MRVCVVCDEGVCGYVMRVCVFTGHVVRQWRTSVFGCRG